MLKTNHYNPWEIASFVAFGSTVAYFIITLILQKNSPAEVRLEFMLLPAAAFVAFGTTAAMKKGGFFMRFGECSRIRTPISFWFSVTFGYAFAASLLAFLVAIINYP